MIVNLPPELKSLILTGLSNKEAAIFLRSQKNINAFLGEEGVALLLLFFYNRSKLTHCGIKSQDVAPSQDLHLSTQVLYLDRKLWWKARNGKKKAVSRM